MSAALLKDAVDAYSGRLEFFKQSSTFSLAGLAGTAFFYTDVVKTSSTVWDRAIFGLSIILFAITSALALSGISANANILRVIDLETHSQGTGGSPTRKPSSYYRRHSLAFHRLTIIAISTASISLGALLGHRLLSEMSPQSPERAIASARVLIGNQTSHSIDRVRLAEFKINGVDYNVSFHLLPEDILYTVTVNKDSGEITKITNQ